MFSQISGVIIFILMIGVPTFAQGTIDEYGNYHPTEDAIARNKRIGELLQYPTVISLRLLSQRRDGLKEEPSTTPSPYSAGQGIHFELFLTQNASENIVVPTSAWPYREYRPELIRDGDMVPYTEAAKAEVEKSEKEAPSGLMGITTLIPGREILWSYVRLEDWYKSPLKIGHYQLIVRKRFTRNGDWVESNPVTFDVIAREPAAPIKGAGEIVLKLILRARKDKHAFGDEIRFQQKMENESDVRVTVENFDLHLQNRPRLLLNGEVVPYKTKTAELIHSKETDLGRPMSVALGFIEPHSLRDLEELDLSDWYDTLQPGSYQLTNKYRPFSAGGWTKESAEIQFRIEPKN